MIAAYHQGDALESPPPPNGSRRSRKHPVKPRHAQTEPSKKAALPDAGLSAEYTPPVAWTQTRLANSSDANSNDAHRADPPASALTLSESPATAPAGGGGAGRSEESDAADPDGASHASGQATQNACPEPRASPAVARASLLQVPARASCCWSARARARSSAYACARALRQTSMRRVGYQSIFVTYIYLFVEAFTFFPLSVFALDQSIPHTSCPVQ